MKSILPGIFENFVNDNVIAVDRVKRGRMVVAVEKAVYKMEPPTSCTWDVERGGSVPKHTSIMSSDVDLVVNSKGYTITKKMRRRFSQLLLEELRNSVEQPDEAVVIVKRIAVVAECGATSIDVVFPTYGKPLLSPADRPNPFYAMPNLQRAVRGLKLLAHLRGDLCSLGPGYRYEALGLLAADTLGEDALGDRAGFLIFQTALGSVDLDLNARLRPVCVSLGVDSDDITDIRDGKLECWINHSRSLLKTLDTPGQVTCKDDMRCIFVGRWAPPLPAEQAQTATASATQPAPHLVARSATQSGSCAESFTRQSSQAQACTSSRSYLDSSARLQHWEHYGGGQVLQAEAEEETDEWGNVLLAGAAVAGLLVAGWALWELSSRSESPPARADEHGRRR